MSRHHYAHASEIEQITHDYSTMTKIEFEDLYGVELTEIGGVYDPVVNKDYDTFSEWAAAQVEEEEEEELAHPHQVSRRFES